MSPQVPTCPSPTKFKLTSPRGAKLATRTWPTPPDKDPKAILLIVHGGGWHSGYFGELAEPIASEGIFCAAYDQPGCGYSDREPCAPEGCDHINSFDDVVEDIFAAVDWAQKEAGDKNLPVYLLGESYGGVQVLHAAYEAEERGVKLDGVILLGGLIRIGQGMLPPRPIIKILVAISHYYPRLKMPATDFSATFDDAFGDKEWAAVCRSDPGVKISPRPTMGMMASVLTAGEEVLKKAGDFPVPLLAIHGEKDCRTELDAVMEFVDKAGPKATIYVVDTEGHQLLQDKTEVTHDVISTVTRWLKNSISTK